ncbi:MAG: ParB/RepB/Spo0J family partition protein [bacterium]|nr:ParB/RepB/Spo0J family partition protein [bacterium]
MNQQSLPQSDPVFLIETDKISPNPYQPRKDFDDSKLAELASSIRELGMLSPILVTKVESDTEYGTEIKYELIAGERRYRAAQLLRMPRVPAIIKNVKLDQHRLEIAIVENVQRANLNPIESAKAYNRLQDEFKLTQREIASRVGKSRESVANTMRLLNLPTQMQEAVAHRKLSESQARILLSLEDIGAQEAIFAEILNKNLSVREVKQRVDKYKHRVRLPQKQSVFADPAALALKKALEEFLGAQVKLDGDGGGGRLTIEYHSAEELRELVEKLTHSQGTEAEDKTDALYESISNESDRSDAFGLDNSVEENVLPDAAVDVSPINPGNEDYTTLGQVGDSPVRMNNLEKKFEGNEISEIDEVGDGVEVDEFHKTEEEHEAVLPATEPEHEVLDPRDEFDPFKSHGF